MNKKDKLHIRWSKKENDLNFHWPGGEQTKCDANYLCWKLGGEFIKELESRGYDIKTLKFEISPKIGNQRFTSQHWRF